VPVALAGLAATFVLVPESRAHERPGLDLVGVALSILGLVALIYGLIQAGQHGWSNTGAVLEIACGVDGGRGVGDGSRARDLDLRRAVKAVRRPKRGRSSALQAINKLGGPLGTAVLGSVLSTAYLAHLAVSGLPAAAATAARQSIFGAVAVADQIRSPALLDSAHTAFVHGMDLALVVSGAVALVGLALTVAFLPQSSVSNEVAPRDTLRTGPDVLGSGLEPRERARHAAPQLASAGGGVDRFALLAEHRVGRAPDR
jgi:hypothetical protein